MLKIYKTSLQGIGADAYLNAGDTRSRSPNDMLISMCHLIRVGDPIVLVQLAPIPRVANSIAIVIDDTTILK